MCKHKGSYMRVRDRERLEDFTCTRGLSRALGWVTNDRLAYPTRSGVGKKLITHMISTG